MANQMPGDAQRDLPLRPLQGPLVPGGFEPQPECWNPDGVATAEAGGNAARPLLPQQKGHNCTRCDHERFGPGHPGPGQTRSLGFAIWESLWYRGRRRPKPGTPEWWAVRQKTAEAKSYQQYIQWLRRIEEEESSDSSDSGIE